MWGSIWPQYNYINFCLEYLSIYLSIYLSLFNSVKFFCTHYLIN